MKTEMQKNRLNCSGKNLIESCLEMIADLRELKWIILYRLLKTLSVIFRVAPIFCLVKLMHFSEIAFLF